MTESTDVGQHNAKRRSRMDPTTHNAEASHWFECHIDPSEAVALLEMLEDTATQLDVEFTTTGIFWMAAYYAVHVFPELASSSGEDQPQFGALATNNGLTWTAWHEQAFPTLATLSAWASQAAQRTRRPQSPAPAVVVAQPDWDHWTDVQPLRPAGSNVLLILKRTDEAVVARAGVSQAAGAVAQPYLREVQRLIETPDWCLRVG